jgi:hypothetical protein
LKFGKFGKFCNPKPNPKQNFAKFCRLLQNLYSEFGSGFEFGKFGKFGKFGNPK